LQQASPGAVPALHADGIVPALDAKNGPRSMFDPQGRQRPPVAVEHPKGAVSPPDQGIVAGSIPAACDFENVLGLLEETAHTRLIGQFRSILGCFAGANVYDSGRADGFVVRVSEFQVHPPTDEAGFQHRSTPGGTVDRDRDGLRTKHRVPRNDGLVPPLIEDGVCVIQRLDAQYRTGLKILEVDAAFHFGLHDIPVHAIAEVGMRLKERWIVNARGHLLILN